MIFYEEKHAKKLLESGFTSFMNYEDLSILAKYFKYIGKNKSQIRKSLVEFCEKHNPYFNEVLSRGKIDGALKSCEKFGLRLAIDVPVTISELDIIKNCGDYKRQKILFVMLVISKYFKYNDTRLTPKKNNNHDNDFYVNYKLIDILKMSQINISKVERKDIIYDLEQSHLITTIKNRDGGTSFQINFIDENSEPSIVVSDMDNIISFYHFYCSRCGKETNKARRHDLCDDCYKEKRREISRDIMREKRKC